MASETLIYTLAKVIISAAWVDGDLDNSEVNSLKDLLFRLDGMTAHDWARIDIYLDSPIGVDERSKLIQELTAQVSNPEDAALVKETLQQMVEADGQVTEEEQRTIQEVVDAMGSGSSSVFRSLSGLMKRPVARRSETATGAPGREAHLDDFINNKIFYEIERRLELDQMETSISEEDRRRLSLAGGLLARVANVDDEISDEEFDFIRGVLQAQWELEPEASAYVTQVAISEISKGMDYFRLTREFFKATTAGEREKFVFILFKIGAADGDLTFEETEEIRTIANGLKLTHQQFIDAKMRAKEE
jgi:uncharacterized tellurite resistance protein B-like protein